MNFRPELARQVMDGTKTVTRRLPSSNPRSPWSAQGCKLQPGYTYAVCPGRGKYAIGRVRVLSVTEANADPGSDAEARREGFASRPEFMRYWAQMHGVFPPSGRVWRIEFDVA